MTSTEPIVERIVQIANSTDHSKAGPHIELYSAVDQLCELGVAARLAGLKSVHRIDDVMARMGVAAALIAKEPGLREGIYREALDLLSRSRRDDDVFLMSELVHIFDDHVPRSLLRSALIRVWKRSSGALRENLSYDLRRRGNRFFINWWFSRFWGAHLAGSALGIVAAVLGYAVTADPSGVMDMNFANGLRAVGWVGLMKVAAPSFSFGLLGYAVGAWMYARAYR
jgi:hypothetical protein